MSKTTLREAWERSTSPAWLLETAVALGADLDKVVSLVAMWCTLACRWAGRVEWIEATPGLGRSFPLLELQRNPRDPRARGQLTDALGTVTTEDGSASRAAVDAVRELHTMTVLLVQADEGSRQHIVLGLGRTVAFCLSAAFHGNGTHPSADRAKLCNDVRETFPLPEDEALTAAGRALANMALERDRALEERTKAQEALGSHAASALEQIDRFQAKIKSCEEALEKERERVAHLEKEQREGASVQALSEIASLCGCETWNYPGQVVRDVRNMVSARRAEVTKANDDRLEALAAKERAEEAVVRAEAHEQDAANARAEAEKLRAQRDEALEAQRTAEERLAASCALCGRVLPEEATGAVAEALGLPRGASAADLVLEVQRLHQSVVLAGERVAEKERKVTTVEREREAALELAEQLTEKVRAQEAPSPPSPRRGALRRLVALEGRLKNQLEALAVEVAQEVRGIHAEYALALEDAVARLDGRPEAVDTADEARKLWSDLNAIAAPVPSTLTEGAKRCMDSALALDDIGRDVIEGLSRELEWRIRIAGRDGAAVCGARVLGKPPSPAEPPSAESKRCFVIGVQVDGETVGTVDVPVGASVEKVVRMAQEQPFFHRFRGREVVEAAYWPGRLLSYRLSPLPGGS